MDQRADKQSYQAGPNYLIWLSTATLERQHVTLPEIGRPIPAGPSPPPVSKALRYD